MYTWKALKVLWVVSTPLRLLDSRNIPAFLGLKGVYKQIPYQRALCKKIMQNMLFIENIFFQTLGFAY